MFFTGLVSARPFSRPSQSMPFSDRSETTSQTQTCSDHVTRNASALRNSKAKGRDEFQTWSVIEREQESLIISTI